MDARTVAAYDRPVPRYTSYPTAAQFGPSVGPADGVVLRRRRGAVSRSMACLISTKSASPERLRS